MKLLPMAIFLFSAIFVVMTTTHAMASRWRSDDKVEAAMYESWLVKHGKLYNTLGEKEKRFQIFKDNLRHIEAHNSGDHSYKLGLNKFADLTNDEYRLGYTGANIPKRKSNKVTSNRYSPLSDDPLPDSVDWRTKGAVAEVKNQRQCGSDYAFSAIGAVEGINQIVTGDLIILSEQQLLDCDTSANRGCEGGTMTAVFDYIMENGGIGTDEAYPYTAQKGDCKEHTNVVSIDGYKDVPEDEVELRKAVAKQPVAAAMETDNMSFQLYNGGIYDDSDCGHDVNAGVLVIGYGTEDGNDYWLVRTSLGSDWGEEGYMRLKRNVDDTAGRCGITTTASYPIKTSQNPTGEEGKEHGH